MLNRQLRHSPREHLWDLYNQVDQADIYYQLRAKQITWPKLIPVLRVILIHLDRQANRDVGAE